eukprot:8610100-Pyramimonas_sp.AAC.1
MKAPNQPFHDGLRGVERLDDGAQFGSIHALLIVMERAERRASQAMSIQDREAPARCAPRARRPRLDPSHQ